MALNVHRDTHGPRVAQEHYEILLAEHRIKNEALEVIFKCIPDRMKKALFDSDGDPVLDKSGRAMMTIKDKHRPRFEHLGVGRYEFVVPNIDEATFREVAANLTARFGDKVVLKHES